MVRKAVQFIYASFKQGNEPLIGIYMHRNENFFLSNNLLQVAEFLLAIAQENQFVETEKHRVAESWPTLLFGLDQLRFPWPSSYAEMRRSLIESKRKTIETAKFSISLVLDGFYRLYHLKARSNEEFTRLYLRWINLMKSRVGFFDETQVNAHLENFIGVKIPEVNSILESYLNKVIQGNSPAQEEIAKWGLVSPIFKITYNLVICGEEDRAVRTVIFNQKRMMLNEIATKEDMAITVLLAMRLGHLRDTIGSLLASLLPKTELEQFSEFMNRLHQK